MTPTTSKGNYYCVYFSSKLKLQLDLHAIPNYLLINIHQVTRIIFVLIVLWISLPTSLILTVRRQLRREVRGKKKGWPNKKLHAVLIWPSIIIHRRNASANQKRTRFFFIYFISGRVLFPLSLVIDHLLLLALSPRRV